MSEIETDTRDALLARVRASLSRKAGDELTEPVPEVDDRLARLADHDDDLIAMFEQRAQEVGMQVYRCTAEQAPLRIAGAVAMLGVRKAVVDREIAQGLIDIDAVLTQSGVALIDWSGVGSDQGFGPQYDADLGVTGVAAALAETGTLVIHSRPSSSRGLSLVPHNHLAVVRASEILPDMLDYWQSLAGISGKDLPSSQVFITGPSKTADIEGVLIQGVHGPGQVVIVLIENA